MKKQLLALGSEDTVITEINLKKTFYYCHIKTIIGLA